MKLYFVSSSIIRSSDDSYTSRTYFFFPSFAKYSIPKHLVIVNAAPDANKELDSTVTPMSICPVQFQGSLLRGKDDTDTNCWTSPNGMGFMIRGKTYLKDNSKVSFALPLNIYTFLAP